MKCSGLVQGRAKRFARTDVSRLKLPIGFFDSMVAVVTVVPDDCITSRDFQGRRFKRLV